jgi:hypothetical protein
MGLGVTRANTVLVWQVGQIGRRMGMAIASSSGGSVTELSVTGSCRGSGDGASVEPLNFYRCSILLIFEKLMYWSKPNQTRPLLMTPRGNR